jgi:hypothetical protein
LPKVVTTWCCKGGAGLFGLLPDFKVRIDEEMEGIFTVSINLPRRSRLRNLDLVMELASAVSQHKMDRLLHLAKVPAAKQVVAMEKSSIGTAVTVIEPLAFDVPHTAQANQNPFLFAQARGM